MSMIITQYSDRLNAGSHLQEVVLENCYELMSSYLLLGLIHSLIIAICPTLNEIINIDEYLKVL